MTTPLLEIRDLVVRYGEIEAVRGLSFSVGAGEVVTLLGSNGAGKSTTLKAISGLVRPAAGTILLEGRPLEGLKPEAIVRLGVAHVQARPGFLERGRRVHIGVIGVGELGPCHERLLT